MPVPDEVNSWRCEGLSWDEGMKCRAAWQFCDDCDGVEGPDDKCSTCTGSGGGYICATHGAPAIDAAILAKGGDQGEWK